MKTTRSRAIKVLFSLAVIIPLVIGCLVLGGVNGFAGQSALDSGDGASVAEAASAATDTWSTGFPTGKKYSYTDIATGITMSGYAPSDTANFGTGKSDRIEVTVSNPSNAADGTQTNPYVISTQADWQSFVTYIKGKTSGTNQYGKGQYFVLNANLDYDGAQIPSLANFYGTFYGTNHVISNAKIGFDTAVNQAYTAAIYQTTSNAYISDLNVYSYTMTTTKVHSAPIVANAGASTVVANCSTIGTMNATSFDSASVSASLNNYAASCAFGGIVAHVNSTNIKIYKCSAKISITINTTYNSRDWFYGGILGGLLNSSNTAYLYDCYSSMIVNSVMGSSSSYFCVSGIVGYSAAGGAYVRNCICIFDAVVTGGEQYAAALGSGNGAGFTNCFSFYVFGNKARSGGAVTKYKLGTGRDNGVNSTNCYAYSSSYTASDSNSAKLNLQDATSVSDLWTRAKSVLNPDIWLHQYLADNTDTANPIDISAKPVHLNSAKITFRYADGSVISLKDSTGNAIDNPIEYVLSESDITDLPTIPAPTAGGTLESNRIFAGWTVDKDSADSKVYKKYSRDMIGNVDMYPVWEITDFDTDITGTTPAGSNIKNAATITYTNDRDNNVVLTANITTACTLDSSHRTYTWYKDGSTTPISGETGSTLTLKNVAQSGKYTVKVTAVASGEVLWRGAATSDEYTVTINRGSLALKSDWAIDGKAFVGEKYSDIKFKATAIDAVTNIKVEGEFAWSYPSMSVKYANVGDTTVTTLILFDPDDDIINNYLDIAADPNATKSFSVTFTPDRFYLIFHVESFGRADLKAAINYDTEYSAAEVCSLFAAELTKFYEDHPDLEAGFSEYAPKLGVPMKDGKVDSEGTVAESDYKFIDEYTQDLPKMKTELTIQIVFEEHPFTLTFDPNGGQLNSAMDATYEFGYNVLIKSYVRNPYYPGNSNMRFQYWYYEVLDETTGQPKEVQWDLDYTRVTCNLTLKAKWREVILTLQSLEVEQYPNVKLIARNQLKNGDLKVTAHYIDDQGDPYEEVLEFDDYKNNIKFVGNPAGPQLHIGSTITVSYSYGNPSVTKTTDPLALNVSAIDLKTEEWDIYLDKDTGERKLVHRVNDDGSPVNLNVRNMVPNDYVNFIDINNIKYTYTDIGGTEVDPSDVNVRGIYTVKIEFPTKSTDHVANPIYVELELKDVTKIFVEWTQVDHYYFSGKVQHPTAALKDADGAEILARDWEYEFLYGDGIKVQRGHNISVKLLNDAYEFDASTSTYCLFEIERALLEAPTVREKIEYAGTYVNLADYLDGYDPDLMEIVSGGREMEVDSYTAIVKIRDDVKANCQWMNGAATQMINWSIEKRTLTAIWSKSTFILADVGSGVNPKVVNFVGMYDDDFDHFDFDTDLLYSGDLAKTEQGAYKISVKLNNVDFSKNYSLSENTECPFVIVLSADVKVITVIWNDIPSTGYVYNGLIQAPSLDNITVLFGDKDITDEVIGYLTLGGDVYTSKWAGTYKATLILDENSGYSIISGFETTYKIVRNQQGEGEKPAGADDPTKPNNGGNGIKEFFEKLLASHFPLWQVATMAVAGLLALIFIIKAAQYGSRAKKANGEAKRIKSRAYAAFLPVFASDIVALNLSNKIWSIMAFAFIGLAVAMFVVAMIMRGSWKKAELAKENAIEERDERRFNGNGGQTSSEFKELKEQLALMSTQQTAAAASGDSMALIEEMRREMEQRRREDEERHRQEMDAMKMMFANMMGRGAGDDGGFAYASIDDTDMLVQRVIAGLLPAVQQMMPEPTAYLAAPQEQNEELLHIVEEQNAQMQAMSEQMSELQSQLASMHEMADAVIIPDNNNDEILAQMKEMQRQISNLDNSAVAADNSDLVAQMNALQQQIANLGKGGATAAVAPDNSELIAKMNQMQQQMAMLAQSQLDNSVLDDYDDEDIFDDDEEEWDSILDEEEDDNFVESVIIEADGTVRKVSPNFRMRLKESSEQNREWYAAVKNLFCSQKGVTYRVCKRVEKIRYQGNVIAVIGIAKRSIKLWLALKPYEYDARRYHHRDVSDKPRFIDVPMYVRVGSDRALTRAQELILALFQEFNMEARKRYNDRDIQELIFTLKHNKLLTNKQYKRALCRIIHVHDCNVLDDETAQRCIEYKNVDFIDGSAIETVKLDDIDAKFLDGNRVTLDKLKKVGLVSEQCTGYTVVADKRLTKPLIIVANDFTMDAVKMIVLTGGRAVRLNKV